MEGHVAVNAKALEFSVHPGILVLQPTPLCNLRCEYCYLPNLSDGRRMDPEIPRRLADELASYPPGHQVEIRWHGGEPLATGLEQLTALIEPFERLRQAGTVFHSLQTNGTFITKQWCEFFSRYDVHVGISIDGPRWANRRRRTLSGAETFARTMAGISRLRDNGIRFSAIAVVSFQSLPEITVRAPDFLGFFRSIGAYDVGFNIEETEGGHRVIDDEPEAVADFWLAMFVAWLKASGLPRIRDFDRVLHFASTSLAGTWRLDPIDLFPTIAVDGDVVLLSPELTGYLDERYGDFKAGNLYEESLETILKRGLDLSYVREFQEGSERCRAVCRYFDYCRAGQAANRYFEHGNFCTHETAFCKYSRQRPFDAVVESFVPN